MMLLMLLQNLLRFSKCLTLKSETAVCMCNWYWCINVRLNSLKKDLKKTRFDLQKIFFELIGGCLIIKVNMVYYKQVNRLCQSCMHNLLVSEMAQEKTGANRNSFTYGPVRCTTALTVFTTF